MSAERLGPLQQQPTFATNVLCLGTDLAANHAAARAIADRSTPMAPINVRTASDFPLVENPSRPQVEFVVVVVLLASELSVRLLQKYCAEVDAPMLARKTAVLVADAERVATHVLPAEHLAALAGQLQVPVYYCTAEEERSVAAAGAYLSRLASVAGLKVPGLSPGLLWTPDIEFVPATLLSQAQTQSETESQQA